MVPRTITQRVLRDFMQEGETEGVPFGDVQDACMEVMYAMGELPRLVEEARLGLSFLVQSDLVTCWTVQRQEVLNTIETVGTHIPSWDTVRSDRRSLFAIMTAALMAGELLEETADSPPVWMHVSHMVGLGETSYRPLSFWVCDASCGDGTFPAAGCESMHVPPGHVALEVELDIDDTVPLSWQQWDMAVSGLFIPADALDGYHFGRMLEKQLKEDGPASTWPWLLRAQALASSVRAVALRPAVEGVSASAAEQFHPGAPVRAQAATAFLPKDDITDVLPGPDIDPDVWWDAFAITHPEQTIYRRHATLPVDRLGEPGEPGDSD